MSSQPHPHPPTNTPTQAPRALAQHLGPWAPGPLNLGQEEAGPYVWWTLEAVGWRLEAGGRVSVETEEREHLEEHSGTAQRHSTAAPAHLTSLALHPALSLTDALAAFHCTARRGAARHGTARYCNARHGTAREPGRSLCHS